MRAASMIPTALATDSGGNIYVADQSNHTDPGGSGTSWAALMN